MKKQVGHKIWTMEEALKRVSKKGVKVIRGTEVLKISEDHGLGNGSWGAVDFLKRQGWLWLMVRS